MKRFVVPLMVVAFLVATVCPVGAEEPYRRVVIPRRVSVAIQPLQLGEEPNNETAWVYDLWPQAIFMHRGGPGDGLAELKPGDPVLLHRDWCAEDEPLRLRVTWVQVISAGDEDRLVLDRVGGNLFALITCHPASDPKAPQRLVVWAAPERPRWPRGLRR